MLIVLAVIAAIVVSLVLAQKEGKKQMEVIQLGEELLQKEDAQQLIEKICRSPMKDAYGQVTVEVSLQGREQTVIVYIPSMARRRFIHNQPLPLVYSAIQGVAVIHPVYVEWLMKRGRQAVSTDNVGTTDPTIIDYLEEETTTIHEGSGDGGFDTSSDGGDGGGGSD